MKHDPDGEPAQDLPAISQTNLADVANWLQALVIGALILFPLSTRPDRTTSWALLTGAAVLGALALIDIGDAIWASFNTRASALDAVLDLGKAFVTIALGFAYVYFYAGSRSNFRPDLNHVDAIYVAVGTLTTAGISGITPISGTARAVMTVQMVVDVVLLVGGVTLVLAKVTGQIGKSSKGLTGS